MKSLGVLGAGGLISSACAPLKSLATNQATGILFPLARGPYQNNGATPWYTNIPMGSPAQYLKFALDTGSNFIWVTSSLCSEAGDSCDHYGGLEFNYGNSSSFAWVDRNDQSVSFGHWGTMTVETGRDYLGLPGGLSNTTMYLAKNYAGSQFAQLDWDGGIGFPAASQYAKPGVSFFFTNLMNSGLIDPKYPYVSFDTDYATGLGSCRVGGIDTNAYDPYSGISMPWTPYKVLPGVEYIWTTALSRYVVGNQTVAQNAYFALDSGSSRFKGDNNYMNTTLSIIAGSPTKPNVTLFTGETPSGGMGQIVIPPEVYEVKIEAGPQAGETLPQFNPLCIPEMVLVGSVIMDLVYTVYVYDVSTPPTGYQVTPVGMWIFNKTSGPEIIRSRSDRPAELGDPRPLINS